MITKAQFFELCDRADQTRADQLYVTRGRVTDWDRAVILVGSTWNEGSLLRQVLYKPHKRNIGKDAYYEAEAKIDKQVSRFVKWLGEWRKLRGVR